MDDIDKLMEISDEPEEISDEYAPDDWEVKNNDKNTHRVWDFTLNNPTDHDIEIVKAWAIHHPVMVVTHEVGKQGTPHLQGRIHWSTARRFAAVKKELPKARWSYSVCPKHNSYPLKQGSNIIVNQDNRRPGTRTDVVGIMKMVDDGKNDYEIMQEFPNTAFRCHAATANYRRVKAATKPKTTKYKHLRWPLVTIWDRSWVVWGEPGIGKTQWALAHFNHALLVTHKDDLKRFLPGVTDGIIFDDMDFRHWPRTTQIHLTDTEEDRTIDVKNGAVTIPEYTKKIFLTNEIDGYMFNLDDPAIRRRVSILHLEKT